MPFHLNILAVTTYHLPKLHRKLLATGARSVLIFCCFSNTPSLAVPNASTAKSRPPFTTRSKNVTYEEKPLWADAFVDSIGVNTHLSYSSSAYYIRYVTMKKLLIQSGIRHLRDGPMSGLNLTCTCNPLNDLAEAGIRSDIILSYLSNQNVDYIRSFLKSVPSIEAFEGPNEVNVNGDDNWIADTVQYVSALYPAIKAINPNLTVVGPSIAWINGRQNTYALLGNLSANMQFGNLHDYPGGRNPGTLGWGPWFNTNPSNPYIGANYGSIAASVFVDSSMASSKAPWATETGYGDATGQTPQDINARYEPRLFLEEWLNGVARTYQYQFLDYGSDGFGNFGLVTSSMLPKPSYYALKNLILVLSDPGVAIDGSPISYTISGANSSVHHLMMQKRNGSLYLAIWIEGEGYNVTSGELESIRPQNISLQLSVRLTSATSYVFSDSGNITRIRLPFVGTIPLTVSDHLQILRLTQ